MQRILLVISCLNLLCVLNVFGQVSGKAFLEGATDHSGITVKFTAISPSAVTDSTLTMINGSYSINIKGGVYIVTFKKDDLDDSYNKGETVLLQTKQVLRDITLSNTIYVQGNQKGRWYKSKKYKVIDDVNIPANDSLIIEAGTTVEFQGAYTWMIDSNAVLKALGTENEKITFKSFEKTIPWRNILIYDASTVFRHCIFQDFEPGYSMSAGIAAFDLYTRGNSLEITNCIFRNFKYNAIYVRMKFIIEQNTIYDFTEGSGILVQDVINSTVRCNHIYNATSKSAGIYATGASRIEENYVHDIDGVGIDCSTSLPDVWNNVVSNVEIGIRLSGSTNGRYYGSVKNNVISYCNDIALDCHWYPLGKEVITSNVFYESNKGIYAFGADILNNSIINNLFYDNNVNFESVDIPYIGILVSVNANGDPVDSYDNLMQDPLFINPVTPIFQKESPLYKAGLNGADIGYDVEGTCVESYLIPSRNPSDTLSISGLVNKGSSEMPNAIVAAIRVDGTGTYTTAVNTNGTFSLDSLPAGDYILKATPFGKWFNLYKTTFYPQSIYQNSAEVILLRRENIVANIQLILLTGLDELSIENSAISPNPFSDQLEIFSEGPVIITDIMGRVVYEGASQRKLDTSRWKTGLYLVKNGQATHKVIKY